MSSFMDYAFPAGDESEASSEEWDIGGCGKKPPRVKDPDAAVTHAEDKASVLKRAISKGDTETVEQLLDNGMDVDTRLAFDWTPLMCAVSVANYDLAKMLLDRGASANFSKDHWTVLMTSCTASAGEDMIARCVELLLSRNADPNFMDRSHMTCVMLAARDGYSKVINLLASYGAEINVQDNNGYTALAIAAQYGREEAVLKLLQLGADKTIRSQAGKTPADLALVFKHKEISRILASSHHTSAGHTFNANCELTKETTNKLDELELLLHGLDLSHLTDIMREHDITWSCLLSMDKEDLEKIGITDSEDQQKLLSVVQQMELDKVDLDTISQLGAADSGSEELLNFLISVRQQCCYLTEMIQDVVARFPRRASQLVFSLDPDHKAQVVCNQLVVETKDLQKEVTLLRSLLCQVDQAEDCGHLPQPVPHGNRKMQIVMRVALSALGAGVLLLIYKAFSNKVHLQMCRR